MGTVFSHPPMLPQSVPPHSTGQSLDNDFKLVSHFTSLASFLMHLAVTNKTAELKSLISTFENQEKQYAKGATDLANRAKDAQNRQLEVMYIIGCVTDWSEAVGDLDIKQQLQLDSLDQKPYQYAELATTIASSVISIVAMFVPGGAVVAIVVPMIGAVISDGIQLAELETRIAKVNQAMASMMVQITNREPEISSLNSQIEKLNANLDAFDQKAFQILNVKSWEDFKNNPSYSGIFKADVTDMKNISTAAEASKAAAAISDTKERDAFMKLFQAKTKLAGQIGEINASVSKASVKPRSFEFVRHLPATPTVGLTDKNDAVTADQDNIIKNKLIAALLKVFNVSRRLSVAIFSAGEILRMLAVSNSDVDTSKLEESLDAMITSIRSVKRQFDGFSNNWAHVAGQGFSKMHHELEALEKMCISTEDEFLGPHLELLRFLLSTRHAWNWDEKTGFAFENNVLAVGGGADKSEVVSLISEALPQLEPEMHILMSEIVTDTVPLPEHILAMC